MQIDEFRSVVTTFSDPGTDLLIDKSRILFSVNGDVIDASISTKSGDVFVDEGAGPIPANFWILKRLARLPLLASRLREAVAQTDHFVSPSAKILPSLEARPEETIFETNDALSSTIEVLGARSPLETTVLYVISDAGEGKTSLINQLAREQAERFSRNEADWLLVPIPLGGRHFLRFDDITVGALQNRYRFPFLYYSSFLALVRMGVIVPAFDGFEEMFVESSSGEALSAMGMLVGALKSTGAVLVAARKAYFEFEDLKAQERLYDSIRSYSVGFGKLELNRWGKEQFLAYCQKREIQDAEKIYERVSERLGSDHSLLTRPVLVRRLVDIAVESSSLETFLERIHASGPDFFSVFVRGIIEREANDKWIDRSGDVAAPLLSVDEHCELLAQIALSMWEAKVDHLKRDHLEFTSDYFCETKRKTSLQSQQIRERVRGHALLVPSPHASQSIEFDHDEFRLFFLGEGLADQLRPLTDRAKSDVLSALRKGVIPKHAQHAFIRAINRSQINKVEAAKFLLSVGALDGQASYTQENCSTLALRLLSGLDAQGLTISGLAFGADALRDRTLSNIVFSDCYFAPSSLEMAALNGNLFRRCKFSQLRIYSSTSLTGAIFDDCSVDALSIVERDLEFWDPVIVRNQLERLGVIMGAQQSLISSDSSLDFEMDAELQDVEKLLRYFMRSTHISESVILMKLSDRGRPFIDGTLPRLLAGEIFSEIENRGGGIQRRFKLAKSLQKINSALAGANGSFKNFLLNVEKD